MTTKPEESEASIAQAIARCEAAQAAYDAAHDDDDAANQLSAAESDAIEILAETPCASDAEFLEKLRFLVARETRIFGLPDCDQEFGPIAVAANLHFITRPPAINPRMIALVAKIDKAIALAEERGTYEAAFKLEDGLAAIAAVNLEELKLKARYVDADCFVGLDKQIGPLLASIIRDLLALGRKAKASVPKEAKEDKDARHS